MDLEERFNATNTTDEIDFEPSYYVRVFLELFTVVALLSLVANILTIFVVLKFKKLRQETTNIILVHVSVMEAVYLLVAPLTMRAGLMLLNDRFVQILLRCTFYENEDVFLVALSLFLLLLVCDWYLKTYAEQKYVKFAGVYKFFVAGIYICAIFFCAVTTQFCFKGLWFMSQLSILIMLACYALLLLTLIAMNVVHGVKKRKLIENKCNVGLAVANIFFACWVPALVVWLLIIFTDFSVPDELLIVFIALGFSSPVFSLFYLFYYENSFNVFVKRVVKCRCNDYENELLEGPTVTYSDASGVKIE